MLDFPRWKTWSISLVILIGILFAIPSMLPADLKARYPTWLPSATINLGLDLAGGSQLLLEADQVDAAKQRLQAMEDQVATELRRDSAHRDRRRFDRRRPSFLPRPRSDQGRCRSRAALQHDPAGRR